MEEVVKMRDGIGEWTCIECCGNKKENWRGKRRKEDASYAPARVENACRGVFN